MNNKELEKRVKDILSIDNYFDMILEAKKLEKEYKSSEFYKVTKMSLYDVLKNAKVFYFLNLDTLFEKIQDQLNKLDTTHVQEVFNQIGDIFGQENQAIMDTVAQLEDFKKLLK